eukprot:1189639-Prorocentrum_minimum.AAC.2
MSLERGPVARAQRMHNAHARNFPLTKRTGIPDRSRNRRVSLERQQIATPRRGGTYLRVELGVALEEDLERLLAGYCRGPVPIRRRLPIHPLVGHPNIPQPAPPHPLAANIKGVHQGGGGGDNYGRKGDTVAGLEVGLGFASVCPVTVADVRRDDCVTVEWRWSVRTNRVRGSRIFLQCKPIA